MIAQGAVDIPDAGRGADHVRTIVLFLTLCSAAGASRVNAQVAELEGQCQGRAVSTLACAAAVDVVEILSARAVQLMAGGNPVAGTASTIGRRVGAPRVTVAGRITAGGIDLPGFAAPASSSASTAVSLNADISVGVLEGLSPAATVGGVASLDLLASAGTLLLPSSDGFESGNPFSWMAGVRVGVLRESFTAPGVSVSATYRRVGAMQRGDQPRTDDESVVRLENASAWNALVAIGKRVSVVGVTAGAGFVWFSSDARIRVRGTGATPVEVRGDPYDGQRMNAFGNLTYTSRVWSFIAELGWQSAGDALTQGSREPASGASAGGVFGGAAIRLTI